MLQVLKKWDSPRAKKWKHWLNYIKLPHHYKNKPRVRILPLFHVNLYCSNCTCAYTDRKLEDFTYRAQRVLNEVDLILAEDTY